jgi:ABC-2 type transport system permease protein
MRELNVWLRYTENSFQETLSHRLMVAVFILAKALRILLFLLFLFFVFQSTKSLAGFSRDQIIFFYLSFNLIDTLANLFFREVYRFRQTIIRGDLDLILTQPIHPLIRVLLGGADVLDFFTLFLILVLIFWFGSSHFSLTLFHWVIYFSLVFGALLIAAALHIAVLGLGVITTSVDHLILIYRDFTSLMRIPVDAYSQPFRSVLTFVIPLAVMYTFPPKALLGFLSLPDVFIALLIGVLSLLLALRFWDFSLRHYQSASS